MDERSDKGDYEQRPEACDPSKASPGHSHQEGSREQCDAPRDAMGYETGP